MLDENLKLLQNNLGKNLLINNKCPSNCYECCSLTVGTNRLNFRKLKKILKKEHLEKYYNDDEKLWWTCPFLINGKCTIYHNPSKPIICKAYICSAELFLSENNPKDLFKIRNDSQRIMFDLLPIELQEKIINSKRVKHILTVEKNVKEKLIK
jgi:hypothetical protein